jgi:HK97 family phage portal protein
MNILQYGNGFHYLKNKIIRDMLIGGNAYIVKLRNANRQLIGLDTVDPRTMKIVANEYGDVVKYIQTIHGKIVNEYMPDDIVNCFDETDPDNEIFGLSIMEGIILEILSDNESALMNYNYFKNSAVPSMVLMAGANTSREELQNTLEQMKRNFAGGKNKHKVGILRGIDKIEKVQDNVSDMNFEIMRGFNTNRICAAFGVPKVIL